MLGSSFWAAFRRASGTSSKAMACLVSPCGSSPSPQPAVPHRGRAASRAMTTCRAQEERTGLWPSPARRSSIIIRNDRAPVARAESLVDLVIHLISQVAHVAVAVEKVGASAMAAEKLVDVALRVARTMTLSRVAQDHPRGVFFDACSGVR